jgi:hypothetical protein
MRMRYWNLSSKVYLILLAIFVSACGDRSVSAEIQTIEGISASGPPQIVDISGNEATLVFQSTIPVSCSVIYGTTTEYGQISTDLDMSGGAHVDHQPLLSGLEPDTDYHYRLQGTAADGTIYISEDMTFHTLPAEETEEVNLASLDEGARVIAVSSNFGGGANDDPWGANNAIDGNRGTEWSSNGDGNDAFIEIELSKPAKLFAIEVWTRLMGDGTAQIFSFTITSDAGDVFGPFVLDDAEKIYRFDVDITTQLLRLNVVDSSGGNTGLVEFGAYGDQLEN